MQEPLVLCSNTDINQHSLNRTFRAHHVFSTVCHDSESGSQKFWSEARCLELANLAAV